MRTSAIAIFCAALASGCATTLPGGGGFTDATAPLDRRQYTVVGPGEATVMSTIFLRQFGSPNIAAARDMAAAYAGGDELVGVVWEVEHRNYFLFRKLGVTVRGTAIKFTDGQTVRATRRVAPVRKAPVQRDHSITLARGALSSEFTSYWGGTYDYGSGWSISYKPRLPNKRWYTTPSVSVTSLDDLTSIAVMWNAVLALDEYITIPVDGLVPYAEAGLGYTPTVWHDAESVQWMRFGWNAGIGAILPIGSGLALDVSANRQASIGGLGMDWSTYDGFNGFTDGPDLTSDPHFWRFGVGLILRR